MTDRLPGWLTAAARAKQLAKALTAHLDRQPNGHRGYVQKDLPPLQAGESRWLGLTFSPSVAALFHLHVAAVPFFKEGGLGVFTKAARFNTKGERNRKQKQLVNSHKAAALCGVQEFVEPALASGDGARIAAGPGVSGSVAAFEVPEDDVRQVAMRERGQRLGLGLKATHNLGPYEPFALYRCYVMTSLEYRKLLRENPGRRADIEAYTVELEQQEWWQPMKMDESSTVVKNGPSIKLVFMGHGYGNEAALINAPQKDPIGLMNEHGDHAQERFEEHLDEDVVGEPNATVAMFYLGGERGFPVPIAMTTDNGAEAGSELLYCYEAGYWETYDDAADTDMAILEVRREAAEKIQRLEQLLQGRR
jgi:hypothetical protein